MVNYKLKSHLLEVVENQLNMNKPKCTKETFNRLMAAGFELNESKEMIASVLTEEMFYVVKNQELFNEERYAKKLSQLPGYLEEFEDREASDVPEPIKVGPSIDRNEPCPCDSGKKYKKCCGK